MIQDWIKANSLDVEWLDSVTFVLDGKKYLCLTHKNNKIFNSDFSLIIDKQELHCYSQHQHDFFCFEFGGKAYHSACDSERVQLNLLKYIGKAKDKSGFAYLGVHGGHELCSGSRSYEDWCKKASFFSVDVLGLAEKNTLGGALKFQNACRKVKIKSIIGETITIRGACDYSGKLYVASEIGWANLLKIHKRLNIDNAGFVEQEFVINHAKGLYLVIQSDTWLADSLPVLAYLYDFEGVFFQFDPVKYKSSKRDLEYLECFKNYLNNYSKHLPLALVCDSYYLDGEDWVVRGLLKDIGKTEFNYQSDNQYFKSLDDVAAEAIDMFTTKGVDFAINLIEKSIENTYKIANGCNFSIPTGEIHLPRYEMTQEESSNFTTNDELFWDVIEKGIEEKIIGAGKDVGPYVERIELEYDIISRGGFVDYFLILRDIINWSEKNGIMVGTGRGSAGGSLIALLCNITKVDPLQYGLIFERFLNESRIGKGLPDIDVDFHSGRRGEVKRYMEQRFGKSNVCTIGTYTALKTKSAFRELLRAGNEQPQIINYYSAMLSDSGENYSDLFHDAALSQKLKSYFDERFEIINNIPLILGQPKSYSMHAAGVIIAPSVDKAGNSKEIFDWFPCKMVDGVLRSEWVGTELDDCGFLKADILGLNQLDKLSGMLDLIEKQHGKRIDLNKINTCDQSVFQLFKDGLTQDVFQFGTDGLSAYSKEMKPDSIEELAVMNALHRPGPMDSGAHLDYVKIKFGKKDPEYNWGCEGVLKSTYGILAYQEQAIKIVQAVGGFTLTEGDGVRKATGKKDLIKMQSYKDKFLSGAIEKGCPEHEAMDIWNKIEVFAGYSFNLSHAIEYSLMGYQTAWLKKYYPLEFWTVSLQHASDKEIHKRIGELRKFDNINLSGPDINKSQGKFFTDWDTSTIYWSLGRVLQVGDVVLQSIMEERDKNGSFFSLEEFKKRTAGRSVNSRVVKHLILSGAFDSLYGISEPMQRKKIIDDFAKVYKVDVSEDFVDAFNDFFWYRVQNELCGFGYFNYATVVNDLGFDFNSFVLPEQVQMRENVDCAVTVGGILLDFVKRKTKKGDMGKLTLNHNNDLIDVILWNDSWEVFKKHIEGSIGRGVMVNGIIQYDGYNKKNCIYSDANTGLEIF